MFQGMLRKARSKICKTETYILSYDHYIRPIWILLKHYGIGWRTIYTIDMKMYNSPILDFALLF